jgi:dTDP-4-amino-4,6-dideoxygalactose transaminase
MPKLAIKGGKKIRNAKFPSSNTIGKKEEAAAIRVIKSGALSKFLGTWSKDFYGGTEVKAFEKEWAKYFKVKHAISVNSATSGLYCAVGASGAGPGDEIIVSPYTMSASATASLIYNAIPVFADIEEDYFCLSADSIEKKITKRTKAILVVDIFGQPYDADKINKIAKKHNLLVIEDCAQAPRAMYKGKYAGTLGDIGIYSLNYHKHIHTGEGGMVVTNNDELAEKIRLIRNHAEVVVGAKNFKDLVNMIGFNYRMTEIEAAIGRAQLKKLKNIVKKRLENIKYLNKKLSAIPCIEPAKVRSESKHVYYVQALKFDAGIAGVHRNKFVEAVKAELSPAGKENSLNIGAGYVKPIYLEPIYQNRIAYGKNGCPWTCEKYNGNVDYSEGICPITEKMHNEIVITHDLMHHNMTKKDLDDVAAAFVKVWENIKELK